MFLQLGVGFLAVLGRIWDFVVAEEGLRIIIFDDIFDEICYFLLMTLNYEGPTIHRESRVKIELSISWTLKSVIICSWSCLI